MSIFNKNPEQKAAKKADKKARKAIVAAHSEAITSALGNPHPRLVYRKRVPPTLA